MSLISNYFTKKSHFITYFSNKSKWAFLAIMELFFRWTLGSTSINLNMWPAINSSQCFFYIFLLDFSVFSRVLSSLSSFGLWSLTLWCPPLIPTAPAGLHPSEGGDDPFAITAIVVTSLLQYLGCKKPLALIMLDMQQKLVPLYNTYYFVAPFPETCSSSFFCLICQFKVFWWFHWKHTCQHPSFVMDHFDLSTNYGWRENEHHCFMKQPDFLLQVQVW